MSWAACGFQTARPAGVTCDAGIDGPDIDSMIDGAPPNTCYGPTGTFRVCLGEAPTGMVTLPAMIDTDLKALPCLLAQPSGWMPSQPESCFIVGNSISVPMTGTRVLGRRPLVLVAQTQITVVAVLDVASHQIENRAPGAAQTPGQCMDFQQDAADGEAGAGGGGGAGGTFMSQGGRGGQGGGGAQEGRPAQADGSNPTRLRGGCPGQVGGNHGPADTTTGRGGGAIYLVAGGSIAINGAINASGAGATADAARTGGSGGGTGGMIVLYAPSITLDGTSGALVANGGGGASGGSSGGRGADGHDPDVLTPSTAAAGGGTGGMGYPALGSALNGPAGSGNGGGDGGGGGAGFIRANVTLSSARISPPAAFVP